VCLVWLHSLCSGARAEALQAESVFGTLPPFMKLLKLCAEALHLMISFGVAPPTLVLELRVTHKVHA
jgi:hypothetical protein